ncbi:MAG: protein-glutamate O-methyltransferase CheR [Gammaproteobacteria bacterium]|nr:protein-glutamate O-methyltransferase CheR [Gammaproteobacteria bacterium]
MRRTVLGTLHSGKPPLQQIADLIAARTGLFFGIQELRRLTSVVTGRIANLRLKSVEEYLRLLQQESRDSSREWREFVSDITVGETYLFRDEGQITLLRQELLPQILEENRNQKRVRIWSAGCSSGEEIYTLAILLDQLLGRDHGWQLELLASDLDQRALAQAELGLYRQWSFRGVAEEIRSRYFVRCGEQWQVSAELRRQIRFFHLNLMADHYPLAEPFLNRVDLIICRNVLIYFEAATIDAIAAKLAATLRSGGILLTGHNELSGVNRPELLPKKGVRSHYHQRSEPALVLPSIPLPPVTRPPPPPLFPRIVEPPQPLNLPEANECEESLRLQLQHHLQQRDYLRVLSLAAEGEKRGGAQREELGEISLVVGQALANMGRYGEAEERFTALSKEGKWQAIAFYWLAQISALEGDESRAKRLLEKVIYLESDAVPALLELARLLLRSGQTKRARQLLQGGRYALGQSGEREWRHYGIANSAVMIDEIDYLLALP